MLRNAVIVFLIFFSSSPIIAQKKDKKTQHKREDSLETKKTPPPNIEFFPKKIMVRLKFIYPTVSINVSDRHAKRGEKFMYLPAMPGVIGFAFKIKKVYVSAAVQLPANENLKKKYGISKFRNINLNIRGRFVEWGLFYRDYKGFYLNNYQKFYPNWNKDSLGYPTSKGLRILETGLNLGFNFNRNFSLNAAFSQGERQKKNSGSFLLGLSERYQRLDVDTSFVPEGQGSFYPNLDKLNYGNFVTTILSFGFGYQFIVKKIHFTPVVMAGSGIQFQNYRQTSGKHFRINIPTYLNARAQLGYNGDHFFANIIYTTEFNSIPIKESRIRLFHNWLEFGVGIRF
jgi:hypothetical protein